MTEAPPAAQRLSALLSEEQLSALAEELEVATQRSGETRVRAEFRCRPGVVLDLDLEPAPRQVRRISLTRRRA